MASGSIDELKANLASLCVRVEKIEKNLDSFQADVLGRLAALSENNVSDKVTLGELTAWREHVTMTLKVMQTELERISARMWMVLTGLLAVLLTAIANSLIR